MLRSGSPLPSLAGATQWLNGEPSPESLTGRPVLVSFWAVSCHLCKDNMPTMAQWKSAYGPRGVRFVSIHMPRQESDMRIEEVERTVAALGMTEPVAIDNEHALGDRFETDGLWPAYFLFDAEGRLRSRAAGAAGLGVMASALERMAPA